MRERFVAVTGLRLREVRSSGKGPPVVFVHGLGVSTAHLRPALRAFARRGPVAAVDLPGFGRSEKPDRPLSVEALADVVGAWLDGTPGGPVPVVANSMGCQVAVELAARRPELVASLVLIGPTVDRAARSLTRQAMRLALDSVREPVALTAVVAFDYLVRAGPLRTFASARLMLAHALEERAPHVRCPTLVMRGERDPIVPQRWGEDLTARFPHGRLCVVPGAAHAIHWSHPEAVLAAARPLLPTNSGRKRARPPRSERKS